MLNWPDLHFDPINLWNVPWLYIPQSKVDNDVCESSKKREDLHTEKLARILAMRNGKQVEKEQC